MNEFERLVRKVCFWTDADNVYRTESFIVMQKVFILKAKDGKSYSISEDLYVPRSERMEAAYEEAYPNRDPVDGKRIPASTYVRTYAPYI